MPNTGRLFQRLRRLRGLKQSHAAELLGVSQSTISRWESGAVRPSKKANKAMMDLVSTRSSAADHALKRLVAGAPFPIHLICDLTHTLLAASRARAANWRTSAGDLLGQNLWRYASDQIQMIEGRLAELGWEEACPQAVVFWTSANSCADVPIAPGFVLWERVMLEDGRLGRLVSTEPSPPAHARLIETCRA